MEIKFNHNWNSKLGLPVFTTIRSFNECKLAYYQHNVDTLVKVTLNGVSKTPAYLVSAEKYYYDNLPFALLAADTGMVNPQKIDELFKKFGADDEVIVLTFSRSTTLV